ncbi:S1C family serine protease [Alicyclobacillus sp. SO9]|uniref:S1C family serine protease n=1 Tax=Alicyclobacillus sp. SO9 TaxID=2665646 RepID=UPI0018E909FF|nr:trypsin-like peptidase domain-containing protein [Alicyclobacillus sp. SO9]QQE80648.1 trypsin-like peptidase domain-containing protein [Alicyclobacillus sp. SO9]
MFRNSSNDGGNNRTSVQTVLKWGGTFVLAAAVGAGTTLWGWSHFRANAAVMTPSVATAQQTSTPQNSITLKTPSPNWVTSVVKKVKPAVMGVVNYTKQTNFFSQKSQLKPYGVGSGVLFYKNKKYGYLVTNHHVVAGAAKVSVVTVGGVHLQAHVVGSDPFTDLAVVRVPLQKIKNVPVVQFANSSKIEAGQPVVAIGNPMGLAFQDSVTSGIVSAKQRTMPVQTESSHQTLDYQSEIQTDAPINPGNSGGPLLNQNGKIIGINDNKIVAQGFSNMGFAIPANEVKQIADEILKTGHVVHSEIGIDGYPLSAVPVSMRPNVPVNQGVWISAVNSSKAKSSGLKRGDVIVSIDGHAVTGTAGLRTYVFQKNPGQKVTLTIYRGQHKMKLHVTLQKYKMVKQSSTSSSSSTQQGDPLNPFSAPGMFG